MSERWRYKSNRERVLRLYGYDGAFKEGQGNVSVHHIVQRSDLKNDPDLWQDFDVDALSNLVPVRRSVHNRTHHLIELHQTANKTLKRR